MTRKQKQTKQQKVNCKWNIYDQTTKQNNNKKV